MFDALTQKLTAVFTRLRGRGSLTEQDVADALREVRLALLEADVNFRVVKEFVATVRERAVGVEVLESLTPAQQVVKVVHEELVRLLGGEDGPTSLAIASGRGPTVYLICGLQGGGKTTTCGKLAAQVRRQGRHPLLVAADVYRPAAIKQLQIVGESVKAPVFTVPGSTDVPAIAAAALEHARANGNDVVIVDTAGRLHIDEQLMDELRLVVERTQPVETLLVLDAMTGKDAVNVAEQFCSALPVTGYILTKLDGDSRGGAAISVRAVTGRPIKLVGISERMDGLEPFHADRMAGRILGMGDVLSLIERAEHLIDRDQAEAFEKRLLHNQFDFNDYLEQLRQVRKMGPLDQLLKALPGMGPAMAGQEMTIDEREMRHVEAMILSMTPAERSEPELLNAGRRRRIAAGSGTSVQDVNRLVSQYQQMKKMFGAVAGMQKQARAGKLKRRFGLPAMPRFGR
jgi:signal recognition particle subunit SRP54